MKLQTATNPQWADAEHTMINITVRFEEIPEDLPFSAVATDPEEHGRDIYARALAGEFGPITEFVPYVPTTEQLELYARQTRDQLLKESDWSQAGDIPAATKEAYVPYRQALRDVPQQAGFPETIEWPVHP